MIQIRKTLFITEDGFYLHCDDAAIEVRNKEKMVARIPPTAIDQIIFLVNATISSYLIKYCNDKGIRLSYVSNTGFYYGRTEGSISGNVLLRKEQFLMLDSEKHVKLVRDILLGKFTNSIAVLNSMVKNACEEDKVKLRNAITNIRNVSKQLYSIDDVDSLRGLEGQVATIYFSMFDIMLKSKDPNMAFIRRTKRPAGNYINALMSLFYTLATRDCVSALESNGLDSHCGYLHALRSGRESLACDLVEEFRGPIVDRFIIKYVNLSKITAKDFENGNGYICIKKDSMKKIIELWSNFKEEEVLYPLDRKKYPIKVIPFLQGRLLAEYIRGDVEEYAPWTWVG